MKVAEFKARNTFFEGKDDKGTLRVTSNPEQVMYIIPDHPSITRVTCLCTIADFRVHLDHALNTDGTLKTAWDAGNDICVEVHHDNSAPADEFTYHFSVAPAA